MFGLAVSPFYSSALVLNVYFNWIEHTIRRIIVEKKNCNCSSNKTLYELLLGCCLPQMKIVYAKIQNSVLSVVYRDSCAWDSESYSSIFRRYLLLYFLFYSDNFWMVQCTYVMIPSDAVFFGVRFNVTLKINVVALLDIIWI